MVNHTIDLVRGDDYSLIVRWLDSADVEVPIASARLQVREHIDDAATLLSLAGGSGLTIAGGQITIAITETQSATLRTGRWDLEAISSGGQTKTLVGGPFNVTEDVSRT